MSKRMSYEAWRISYQSSEQAARAAHAEVARLLDALERKDAALRGIDGPCEHIYKGRCYEAGGFTDDSDEWATRTCNPCIAHRALTETLRDVIRLLAEDGHPAYAVRDGDRMDDSLYEAFQTGHLTGCKACIAAFTARAALEGAAPPEQHPSPAQRIRAWFASVPLRVTRDGVTRLDFAAWRRGERREG